MSDARHTPASGFDWESAEDLTSLPEPELRRLLARVVEEERAAAFRREVLRWRGDLIRAELAGRGIFGLSSEDLARVLLGEEGSAW
jgi:anti-sigma-K factor RsiG